MGSEDPLYRLCGGFLPLSENHRSEEKNQEVDSRQSAGDLHGTEEPRGVRCDWIEVGFPNQYSGLNGLGKGSCSIVPAVLFVPMVQADVTINKNRQSEAKAEMSIAQGRYFARR